MTGHCWPLWRRRARPGRCHSRHNRQGYLLLQDAPDWPFRVHQQLEEERRYLSQELEQAAVPRLPKRLQFPAVPGEEGWRERLLDRGILIRSCADFQGLGPGFTASASGAAGKIEADPGHSAGEEAFHG